MASKIKILKEKTINQIAAGEVVENPASVVKELVENSLDALATEITVDICGGGFQSIQISDDGVGMSGDDVLLSIERHATSKIESVDDLQKLSTMGFRGEALASIASISKMTIKTTSRDSVKKDMGIKLECEGGVLKSLDPFPRKPGTTIEIRSLFYTVPARKKFQKTPEGALSEISKILTIIALSHPLVSFKYSVDGVMVFHVEAEPEKFFFEQMKTRIDKLLGKEFMRSLKQCVYTEQGVEIKGFISEPLHHRQNRGGQYLFLNQRAITSPLVSSAIKDGYSTMIPEKKYPLFVLFMQLDPASFDVNVHPQKKEVRFHEEMLIRQCVRTAVSSSLHRSILSSGSILPMDAGAMMGHFHPYRPINLSIDTEVKEFYRQNVLEFENKEKTKEYSQLKTASELNIFEVIGLWKKYAFVKVYNPPIEDPFLSHVLKEKLLLVDLKALSRRLFYEELKKGSFLRQSLRSLQDLMIPITLECSVHESKLLNQHLTFIEKLGIGVRPFGDKVFVIDALHPTIQAQEAKDFIYFTLKELERSSEGELSELFEKLLLSLVKQMKSFKNIYPIEEAKVLIEKVNHLKGHHHCPKGEPIFIFLSEEEIEDFMKKQLSINAKQLLHLSEDNFPPLH